MKEEEDEKSIGLQDKQEDRKKEQWLKSTVKRKKDAQSAPL